MPPSCPDHVVRENPPSSCRPYVAQNALQYEIVVLINFVSVCLAVWLSVWGIYEFTFQVTQVVPVIPTLKFACLPVSRILKDPTPSSLMGMRAWDSIDEELETRNPPRTQD